MKKVVKIWNETNLILKIAVGMAIGVLCGIFAPQASFLAIIGDIFIKMLRTIAPILVFVLVTSSLANSSSGIGKTFGKVIGLYMLSTLLAAVTAVIGSFLFPITITLTGEVSAEAAPGGILDVLNSLLTNMIDDPVSAMQNANYIGILACSVVFGLALKKIASKKTIDIFNDLSETVSQIVQWIISLAPFGIMGLVFDAIATGGLQVFSSYGTLLLLLIGCMATVVLVVNPLIVAICLKKNPYPLVFRCIKDSGITAFFTRSSAANIPVNLSLCEKLGLDKNLYSVSIPLGATINMDGAAVTITVMSLAAAHTVGIQVDLMTAILLCILSTLAACGASGVAGGSILLIPMACSLFGIENSVAMQVVSIGFIIGIVQDSFETALNSSSDVLFAATAEFMERNKNKKKKEEKELTQVNG